MLRSGHGTISGFENMSIVLRNMLLAQHPRADRTIRERQHILPDLGTKHS